MASLGGMAPPTHDSAPRPRPDLLLVGALVLFLVIRGASLLRWDLWYDELFGVGLGYLDWGPLLARAAADQTNPPLFYLLLKGWMGAIPATPLTLRLLPALISAATLVPLLRLLGGMGLPRWTRISVVLLAACSPLLVFYAVEIRAYGLLALLSTAAMA